MSLKARLDRIRTAFEKEAPAEALAVMHGARDALRASGIVERSVGEGRSAPDFTLTDSSGNQVSLAALRQSGPVVLTFFRGNW